MKNLVWVALVAALLGCTASAEQQAGLASFDVPAPTMVEGLDKVIGLDSFGDQLSVHVSYPAMAVGHTVGFRWKGKKTQYLPVQTVKQVGTLVFKVPRSLVAGDLGGTAQLTSSVGVGDSKLIISAPLVVKVEPSLKFQVPAPKLSGIDERGDYRLGNSTATVEVNYPAMKVGDRVGLRWAGRQTRDLPLQKVETVGPVSFKVPAAAVSSDAGSAVIVTASVGGDGNPLRISQALSVRILEQSDFDAPIAEQASKGELDINQLAAGATIKVDGRNLRKGDVVGMRWQGGTRLDLPTQKFHGTGDIRFQVDKSAVAKDLDKTVRLTASLGRDGKPLVISAPLELKVVKSALSPGQVVAARLNQRYRAVPAACTGNKPAYYCSGVMIRGTNNDAFDPWNPSPSAERLGSVSFSYLRMDSHVTGLYNFSGFIFSDQETAIAQGKAQTLRCIYPYNAGTVGNLNKNGCGSRTLAVDQSSCAAKGVTTAAQWVTHARSVSGQNQQCSLSTQVPGQFVAALQAKATRLPNMSSAWNEVLVQTWAQNIGDKLPIEAFFYNAGSAQGAVAAKAYQTKYKTRTRLWVPVVRLNPAQYGKGDLFQYLPADQAVQP